MEHLHSSTPQALSGVQLSHFADKLMGLEKLRNNIGTPIYGFAGLSVYLINLFTARDLSL